MLYQRTDMPGTPVSGAMRPVSNDGSHLVVRSLTKRYGETPAVDAVDLSIGQGEFVTLLGDSGCGKTTLLRMIAGFTTPDGGQILSRGEDVTHLAPAARRMGFVFQSYALFPTKTAEQNIGFAPRMAGKSRAEIRRRVRELAEMVEIDRLLDRYPHELSGGQQQRVALARALAAEPEMLLLDEPMSALDARIRAKLRTELRGLVDRLGMTALYVTHDQEEALAMSDRVAVMRAGRIEQIGTPDRIYHRPATRFVAEFIGVSNILEAKVMRGGVVVGDALWPCDLGLGEGEGGSTVSGDVGAAVSPAHLPAGEVNRDAASRSPSSSSGLSRGSNHSNKLTLIDPRDKPEDDVEQVAGQALQAITQYRGGLSSPHHLNPICSTPAGEGDTIVVMIRPEHVLPAEPGSPGSLNGTVESVTFLGSTVRLVVNCAGGLKIVAEHASTSPWARLERQAPVTIRPDLAHLVFLEQPAKGR